MNKMIMKPKQVETKEKWKHSYVRDFVCAWSLVIVCGGVMMNGLREALLVCHIQPAPSPIKLVIGL